MNKMPDNTQALLLGQLSHLLQQAFDLVTGFTGDLNTAVERVPSVHLVHVALHLEYLIHSVDTNARDASSWKRSVAR